MVDLDTIYNGLDWTRYIIVRLFICFGIMAIFPTILMILLEPLIYIIRTLDNLLPGSFSIMGGSKPSSATKLSSSSSPSSPSPSQSQSSSRSASPTSSTSIQLPNQPTKSITKRLQSSEGKELMREMNVITPVVSLNSAVLDQEGF